MMCKNVAKALNFVVYLIQLDWPLNAEHPAKNQESYNKFKITVENVFQG